MPNRLSYVDRDAESSDTGCTRRTMLRYFMATMSLAYTHVLSAEDPERPRPLRFDGAAHVRVPRFSYDGRHPLTVEMTVVPDGVDRDQTIMGNQQGGGFGLVLEKGHWVFLCHNGEHYVKARSDQPAKAGAEASLMAVCDGRSIRLYINGVLQQDVPPWKGRYNGSGQPLLLGADPDGSGKPQHPFVGTIAALRVSATAIDTFSRWTKGERTNVRPDHLLFIDGRQGDVVRDRSIHRHSVEWRP